jgi:hypothetical protein
MSEPVNGASPPERDGSLDVDVSTELRAVLEAVPRGAFALTGLALSLLLIAWLFVYFCVFLTRGPVS